jgi:hypothetical protein
LHLRQTADSTEEEDEARVEVPTVLMFGVVSELKYGSLGKLGRGDSRTKKLTPTPTLSLHLDTLAERIDPVASAG